MPIPITATISTTLTMRYTAELIPLASFKSEIISDKGETNSDVNNVKKIGHMIST